MCSVCLITMCSAVELSFSSSSSQRGHTVDHGRMWLNITAAFTRERLSSSLFYSLSLLTFFLSLLVSALQQPTQLELRERKHPVLWKNVKSVEKMIETSALGILPCIYRATVAHRVYILVSDSSISLFPTDSDLFQ